MAQFILSLASPEATLATAGGKGANLGALSRAGVNVPPGFIITTDAYRQFVSEHGLQPKILAAVNGLDPRQVPALDRASAETRALFEKYAISATLKDIILAAYEELSTKANEKAVPVAVRSSATAEDLPGLAFAGQQETYLNVIGESELLRSVVRCWSSLWTARAIAYRARNGIQPEDVALAVVVQCMVASESSGVLFTANPLSGRRDEQVIDASFGLGEAIVSGQVDPDHHVVRSGNWAITERHLGAKALAILPAAEGGTTQVTQDLAGRQALPDTQIIELAQTGARIAEQFGSPQDIEWAFAEGVIYILQSRPITSLYPVPPNPYSDPGLRIYASLNSIQGVTGPFTPLGADTLRMLVGAGFVSLLGLSGKPTEFLPYAGDRLFIDVTALARDPKLRHIVSGLLERGDPGALSAFKKIMAEGRIPDQPVLTRRVVFHLLPRLSPIIRRFLGTIISPQHAAESARKGLERATQAEREHLQTAMNLSEKLDVLQRGLAQLFRRVLTEAIPVIAPSMLGLTIVEHWLQNWLGDAPGGALRIMRGLPGNVTTEMDLALWQTALAIRADSTASSALRERPIPELVDAYRRGALPTVAQTALSRFLDQYGMRAVTEIDIGRPRWHEDPAPVLAMLAGYLDLQNPDTAPDVVFDRNRRTAEELSKQLVARTRRTKMGWLRARILAAAIRRMRMLGGLRELPKFKMIQVLDLYRSSLLSSGRDLAARGELGQPEDIFFIPFEQLGQYASGRSVDLKAVAEAERKKYDQEMARRQMPRLLLSTGEAFYGGVPETEPGRDILTGDPVSPGIAEGVVQVVIDPRGARLDPGAILVCPATDPGWTPLFLTASGLVMEIGGLVTHGSVVAREYGIPAVVGVHNATSRLQTGQRVRVDGNVGRITILGKESSSDQGQ